MQAELREREQNKFMNGEYDVIVATNALVWELINQIFDT